MATSKRSTKKLQGTAATFAYVLGGCSVGLIVGGLAGRVLSDGIGFDGLSDVLGGIGTGVFIGAVLTLGTARRLAVQRRARIGSMLFLCSALVFAVLMARSQTPADPAPVGAVTPDP